MRGAISDGVSLTVVEQFHGKIRLWHEVKGFYYYTITVALAAHSGAHDLGTRSGQIEGDRKLFDARQGALGTLRSHRVHVKPPLAAGTLARQPFRVARDDASRCTGSDRIKPGVVSATASPLKQRGISSGARVDIALVLLDRGCALLDSAPKPNRRCDRRQSAAKRLWEGRES